MNIVHVPLCENSPYWPIAPKPYTIDVCTYQDVPEGYLFAAAFIAIRQNPDDYTTPLTSIETAGWVDPFVNGVKMDHFRYDHLGITIKAEDIRDDLYWSGTELDEVSVIKGKIRSLVEAGGFNSDEYYAHKTELLSRMPESNVQLFLMEMEVMDQFMQNDEQDDNIEKLYVVGGAEGDELLESMLDRANDIAEDTGGEVLLLAEKADTDKLVEGIICYPARLYPGPNEQSSVVERIEHFLKTENKINVLCVHYPEGFDLQWLAPYVDYFTTTFVSHQGDLSALGAV